MIDVGSCPSTLKAGFSTYSPRGLKILFDGAKVSHVLDFDIDEFRNQSDIVDAMYRISVSGVQEKFAALVDSGRIRIAQSQERSKYILKPAPWDRTVQWRKQIPANEHLTMQIAAQVYGIATASNGLCFTKGGRAVYITKRFDLKPDGNKVEMEDFATLVGKNEQTIGSHFKYTGSYEDIALAIRKNVAAWMVDMERFFEMVVFNYIYANGDAHLKNFSLIRIDGDYRLAPAYDLLNTCLHVRGEDFCLDGGLSTNIERSDVYDHTGHPCRRDFELFGQQIGLLQHRAAKILDKYVSLPDAAVTLIINSFLSEKLKRSYRRIVEERISRFVRVAE